MQFSSKARKAVAAGLALSTVLMSVSLFALPAVFAAPHAEGCLVNASGTVYMITGGQRRGFPSEAVFISHGNGFGGVQTANSEDLAMPVGPVMVYNDGTLVKGPNDPLVYLVANGQKRGFTSGSVFTGLGFKFSNIQSAAANTFADLPTGANVESATERHTNGVWVLDSTGTVWRMTATGRMGLPSMAVFNSYGKSWATVVPANAADMATTNEGVVSAKASCSGSTTPTGSVNVSVAGPASSTLIVNQATAKLADFVFTGNGTVTSLTLKRVGVSADTTLEDVFLFDGDVRITDSAAVSSGNINFTNSSGLFTVNGSKTISVRADIAGAAGETLGVQLTGATLSNGTVGGLPASANMHTLASATLAGISFGAASDSGNTDAANDIVVWQSTATITTRDVTMTRLALRNTGSINSADIKNFRLYIDGTQVASQSSLDANGYVTFSFNKTLTTGGRIIKVVADVVGGSGRTVLMSLRGTYDVVMTDSQYGANIESTLNATPLESDGFTVGSGTISAVKATDSPSGNIINNASDVSMGKWTVTAYGEPIRIETLNVGFNYTEQTDNDNDATPTLRNGRLLINGSQYGSTTTVVDTGTSFTVNYTVNPGTPITVEFRADVFDNDSEGAGFENTDDIQVFLNNTGSGFKQVSGGSVTIPGSDQNANSLNVATGAMTATVQTNYPSQTITIPRSQAFKLGAFNVTGDSTETVNLNTIAVHFDGNDEFESADLSNVYVIYGSTQSSIKSTIASGVTDDADASWSINYTLAANQVLPVEVWASINNFTVAGGDDTMQTGLVVTGVTQGSGQTVYASQDATDSNYLEGQTMTAGTGTLTTALSASNPLAKITEDNKTITAAAFQFTAANDTFTITEVTLGVNSTSAVNSLVVKGGASDVTRPAASSVVVPVNISVPANQSKTLTVDLVLGQIGTGITSGQDVKISLTAYKATNSQGEQKTNTDDTATASFPFNANSQYVFAAIPTIAEVSIPAVDPVGTVEVAKWTVTPVGGAVSVKQFAIAVTITENGADATLTAGTFKFYRDGVDITDLVHIVNAAGNADLEVAGTLAEGTNTAYVTFDTEESIDTARTYTLKSTLGGAWATGDSLRAEFSTDTVEAEKDLDGIAATGPVELVLADGTGDTGVQDLVWSDLSAIPHSAVIGADDATPDSSSDWTNGYLVKNLPLSTWSLTY